MGDGATPGRYGDSCGWVQSGRAPEIRQRRHDVRMEFQLVVSAPPDSHLFEIWVEPEGMMYELPGVSKVVLSFRGADAMTVELSHRPNAVVIWRPSDTEVWASTTDGTFEQIAGWRHNPFPGLDSPMARRWTSRHAS